MLDHFLVDLISTIRHSFDEGLLQRQALEERFQVDVFLGDVSWETSYSLPGEELPPRVRADLSLDWPTWSQTAYRSWSIGESLTELPEVVMEVALRIQRLAEAPEAANVLAVLPADNPVIGSGTLARSGFTIEQLHSEPSLAAPADGEDIRWAVEVTYEGSFRFDEENLERSESLRPLANQLTRWISSTLVRLADLPLAFLPASTGDEE